LDFVVLLRGGKKPADPNNLLKTFIFADFEDDLLRVTKLPWREPVTKVNKLSNVAMAAECCRQAPKKIQMEQIGRLQRPKRRAARCHS
jgi:hypothetical protein